jgi:hypothetical protein
MMPIKMVASINTKMKTGRVMAVFVIFIELPP